MAIKGLDVYSARGWKSMDKGRKRAAREVDPIGGLGVGVGWGREGVERGKEGVGRDKRADGRMGG